MKKKDCGYSSIGAQKAETSFGIIPANKKIIEMTKIVKPNFIQLIEDLIIVSLIYIIHIIIKQLREIYLSFR